MEVGTETSRNT